MIENGILFLLHIFHDFVWFILDARYIFRALFTRSSSTHNKHQQTSSDEPNVVSLFTEEHRALRKSLRQLIDIHINPYVDEWETNGPFPAHRVFKLLGSGGFLGVNKPLGNF